MRSDSNDSFYGKPLARHRAFWSNRDMDRVGCQKSAGRLFGVASVAERYSKMNLRGDRSPVTVPELSTEPRIDGLCFSLPFRWDDHRAFPGLAFMAEGTHRG